MSFSHHWRVVRQALRDDRERQRTALRTTEHDFLPAALEVIERPVSPTARVTTWVLLVGLVVTVAWLIFGRLDVVASATGTVIPTGSVKLVQSADPGVVRVIHVHEGDRVVQGQALVDLDPTLTGADFAQAQKALAAAELDVARNAAIADALAGKGLRFSTPQGTDATVAATQVRLITAQLAEVEATAAGLESARRSALADAQAASAQMTKLTETLPILDRQLEAMRRLDAKGYAPGLRLLDLERQRRAESGDRDIAVAQQQRGLADARKLGSQALQAREQARHTALADLAKAQAEVILRREEVTKAGQRSRFQQLKAPVTGTVQQLAVHTVGGVVEAAKPLMVLVPERGGVVVEARLLNRDAGFVRQGQPVSVKLEAYPFTRFGTVPGRITSISRDAIVDEKLGPVYVVRIALDRSDIDVNGRRVPLGSGLVATADIRTGTRRIISYLLSPLQTSVAQAGHEK